MRYFDHNWIQDSPTKAPARGNTGLALLLSALILGLGAAAMILFVRPSSGSNDAVVYITIPNMIIETKEGAKPGTVSGSGAIINKNGLVITNLHVAFPEKDPKFKMKMGPDGKPMPKKIYIWLYSGTNNVKQYEASIEDYDRSGKTWTETDFKDIAHDWAVLKFTKGTDTGDLPVMHIGDSHTLKEGTPVHTVGYPLGSQFVAVPEKGPNVSVGNGGILRLDKDAHDAVICLRHSCPQTYGNSGGPLVNEAGELVGINTGGSNSGEIGSEQKYSIPEHAAALEEPWKKYAEFHP